MVLELCNDKDWDWELHITAVVKYSKLLAKKLGADEEVCEISAWLHDIQKVKGNDKDHHIKGALIAAEILRKYNYPEKKIEQVKHCILTHSSKQDYIPESQEAKIVATADALSHFDNFLPLVQWVYNNFSVEERRPYLVKKYKGCWDKLIPEAKEIAKPKYEAIKVVLE